MSKPNIEEFTLQEQNFMLNPFELDVIASEEQTNPAEDFGKFLKWAHTMSNPFSSDFLVELDSLVRWVEASNTTPGSLNPGGGITSRLEVAIELLQAEKARLDGVYAEYKKHLADILANYTEEDAAAWLKANMPEAYVRATSTSPLMEDVVVSGAGTATTVPAKSAA